MKTIFIIDYGELQWDKNAGWNLIGINEELDGYLSDHDYFGTNADLFDITQSNCHDIKI